MVFKKQTKISNNFGAEYIEHVIEFLEQYFSISFEGRNEIEMDLIYFDYIIDRDKISFISEGVIGTYIYGKKKIIKKIIKKVEEQNPLLFEVLID